MTIVPLKVRANLEHLFLFNQHRISLKEREEEIEAQKHKPKVNYKE